MRRNFQDHSNDAPSSEDSFKPENKKIKLNSQIDGKRLEKPGERDFYVGILHTPISDVPMILEVLKTLTDIIQTTTDPGIISKSLQEFIEVVDSKVDEDDRTLIISMDPNDNDLLLKAEFIVLSRLSTFAKKFQDPTQMVERNLKVFTLIYEYMDKTKEAKDVTKALRVAHLVNPSRGFLDTFRPGGKTLETFLQDNPRISHHKEIEKAIGDAVEFFKKYILGSKLFESALEALFEQYSMSSEVGACLKIYQEMDVIYVDNVNWNGMVGFEHTIYISSTPFSLKFYEHPDPHTQTKKRKVKLLQLIMHEGIHLGLRSLKQSFLAQTPECSTSKTPGLEGGYRLEELIWGHFNIAYYHEDYVDIVLNPDNWKNSEPLLKTTERFHHRGNFNYFCSGMDFEGLEEVESEIDM